MYSQAYSSACKSRGSSAGAQPSVIVDTEKVLAGSGWTRANARGQCFGSAHGWKGGRSRVHSAGYWAAENPKITSDHEDHIIAKGIHSLSRYNLVDKFTPMLQA